MIITTIGFQSFLTETPEDATHLLRILNKADMIDTTTQDDGIQRYFCSGRPAVKLHTVPSSHLLSTKEGEDILKLRAERTERLHQQATEEQE